MAELSFEELLRGLSSLGEQPAAGGRLTAEQYAEAERRAAQRAADLAKYQVDRSAGVSAAEKYLGRAGEAAKKVAPRIGAKSAAKRLLSGGGVVGAGLLANEALQGALELGVGMVAPERPAFIPPEVHRQIMERIGTVDPGRDSFWLKNRTGPEDVPGVRIDPASIQFPTMRGTIPSSQEGRPAAAGAKRRRPVDPNAIDDPSIPIERGTGVIRNEQTGRVFTVDARDTVNRQFEGVPVGPRLSLPKTGFSDIDAAMPGIVMAAIQGNRAARVRATEAAAAKEAMDFQKAVALERLKQSAPSIKVLEPAVQGQPPTVVITNPTTGQSTVQAAMPPGQDRQSMDAATRDLAARRPDLLKLINEQRKPYKLDQIPE